MKSSLKRANSKIITTIGVRSDLLALLEEREVTSKKQRPPEGSRDEERSGRLDFPAGRWSFEVGKLV